jgi:hypothetical protein
MLEMLPNTCLLTIVEFDRWIMMRPVRSLFSGKFSGYNGRKDTCHMQLSPRHDCMRLTRDSSHGKVTFSIAKLSIAARKTTVPNETTAFESVSLTGEVTHILDALKPMILPQTLTWSNEGSTSSEALSQWSSQISFYQRRWYYCDLTPDLAISKETF